MSPTTYKRIYLAERPTGDITSSTFKDEDLPFDLKPGAEQILVQVTYISLDPAMRGWLRDTRSYLPPVQIGETMRAGALATVREAGEGSKFKPGDLIYGTVGWTEYAVIPDKAATKIDVPPGAQPLDFLNTLGMPGLTAYFGLKDIGELKSGETLVVSGAAGAVGSLACQLGKKVGARVIAIAGSDEKCAWLESELGVDRALNYKSPTFKEDVKTVVGYLDVFFDNVGGDMLDFMLTRLNKYARIVLCGAISEYNSTKPRGLTGYLNLISQRAKIQGFIVFDYAAQYPQAIKEMSSWLADGSVKRKFHVVKGLEKAPEALPMLFNGGNTGKLVVEVVSGEQSKI